MDETNSTKFVDFETYCPKCEHWELKATQDPCDECLTLGAQQGTSRPLYFKEKQK